MDLSEILNVNEKNIISYNYLLKKSSNYKKEKIVISTGSKNFDKVLGGGFFSGKKYLIFGANKTGKTQLSHQICVQTYKQLFDIKQTKKNSNNLKLIYYFDTENTFRPERIKELAVANNLNYNKVLKTILVAKIMSNSALLLSLKNIEEHVEKDEFFVFIIDSINNYYRYEQGNKEVSFHEIKTTFMKILKKINELNNKFNLIIIATAQVAPNFIDNAIIENIPVGNQYLNHFFSEYLFLSYKDEKNYVHLINSHSLPERKVLYEITSEGIEDYKI